jgi:hypothetical protein
MLLLFAIKQKFIAGWSSLAARVAHNHEVVGSNPTPATFERERGRENGSFPGVEVLKPQGFKEQSDVRFLLPQHSNGKGVGKTEVFPGWKY